MGAAAPLFGFLRAHSTRKDKKPAESRVNYQVRFTPQALEDISQIDTPLARRVIKKIEWLAEHLDSLHSERLTGPFAHLSKLRIGDWRVLYETDPVQRLITVHVIAHRSKIYKTEVGVSCANPNLTTIVNLNTHALQLPSQSVQRNGDRLLFHCVVTASPSLLPQPPHALRSRRRPRLPWAHSWERRSHGLAYR
ncbi:MAG: type II toxin-antitoxin system RelE/ParE family toxin [Nitrospirae bacterium]|nr:MAG: type II toxin-antitoxin system RelE/ParE family toxin [Nitrospirota bacterium]